MGVCSSHFPSQRRVQTTNPSGLDGTVLQEGNEAYASGEDVLPMGAQALGSSHACYQHPPSRVRNAGTTTTNVDSHTGDKIKASGDPRHHWGGLEFSILIHGSPPRRMHWCLHSMNVEREREREFECKRTWHTRRILFQQCGASQTSG